MGHNMKRLFAGLALSLVATAAIAAPATGSQGTYTSASGVVFPGTITQQMGLENGNGALCLLGSDTTCQLPVNASVSASIAAFAPTGQAALTAATTTSSVALGSVGPTALVTNNGSVTAYINFGGSGVTATTSSYPVNAGQSVAFNNGSNTYIAGITGASTAALSITTGTGLPAIASSSSGGGGGGGAITAASGSYAAGALSAGSGVDGWDLTEGAKADSAYAGSGSASLIAISKGLYNAMVAATPAGSAIIGKVGIDQTTPGTTNGVQVNAALPAGTNVIGHVVADTGSTTAVTGNVTVVQPTGTNLHAVLDTTSTTAVTQATGTNLHTVVDSGSITATQATGSNLHVQVDTAPSTAVTNAGTFAVQAALAPATSGGLSSYVVEPAASDNHANIKNGAGQVYHITAFNNSGTINYLRLYNAATGFNGCGSATNLVWEGHIPANTSDAGFVEDISQGLAFSTGISICVTGAYGQTSTTNATASAISINVLYK